MLIYILDLSTHVLLRLSLMAKKEIKYCIRVCVELLRYGCSYVIFDDKWFVMSMIKSNNRLLCVTSQITRKQEGAIHFIIGIYLAMKHQSKPPTSSERSSVMFIHLVTGWIQMEVRTFMSGIVKTLCPIKKLSEEWNSHLW